ncbi:hypothetical protein [Micavibrio aeruginosavorus]|uniref:hypothetical protein n=1 Tax=Micavibrio aeruginosavorus TaxID=349221 RepID=UPI003F4ACBAD
MQKEAQKFTALFNTMNDDFVKLAKDGMRFAIPLTSKDMFNGLSAATQKALGPVEAILAGVDAKLHYVTKAPTAEKPGYIAFSNEDQSMAVLKGLRATGHWTAMFETVDQNRFAMTAINSDGSSRYKFLPKLAR